MESEQEEGGAAERESGKERQNMNREKHIMEHLADSMWESLMNTLEELDAAFEEAIRDPEFLKQYHYYLEQYVGGERHRFITRSVSVKSTA